MLRLLGGHSGAVGMLLGMIPFCFCCYRERISFTAGCAAAGNALGTEEAGNPVSTYAFNDEGN